MECRFAHWICADTHRSGIQRSRGRWSDSAFGAGETGNEGRSWRNGRPLQNNEPADLIAAEIPVLTLSLFWASAAFTHETNVYARVRIGEARRGWTQRWAEVTRKAERLETSYVIP